MKAILGILISFTFVYIAEVRAGDSSAEAFSSLECSKEEMATKKIELSKLRVGLEWTQSKKGAELSAKILKAEEQCQSRSNIARKLCLTCTSPEISKAATGIGVAMSALDLTKGQAEACKKFGGVMDIAKAGIAAYNAACGGARMACSMGCEKLNVVLEQSIAELEVYKKEQFSCYAKINATPPPISVSLQAQAQECFSESMNAGFDIKGLKQYQASGPKPALVVCDTYKLKLAAGATGLLSIIQKSQAAKTCENQLTADSSSGDLDCSKPENAKVVECMCRTNPTLAGCAGGGSGSNDPYQNLAGDYSESSASSDSNVDLSATPSIDTSSAFASESGSGGAAGFNNGGGGQGGIAGNGSGKAADGSKVSARGLNKNILSGYEGGSGGGKGGSSGYSDDGYANQFKAFMPGGDKDPSRNPANAVFAGGQVTGAGSKSNWEKVSERYQANRPSFIQGGP